MLVALPSRQVRTFVACVGSFSALLGCAYAYVGQRRKRERREGQRLEELKITRSPSRAETFRATVSAGVDRGVALGFCGDLVGPVVAPSAARARRFFGQTSLRAFLGGDGVGGNEAALDAVRWTRYAAGDVVCRAGEPADSCLVVACGRCDLSVDGVDRVGTLGPGESTGHLCALFAGGLRHRTLVARAEGTVVASVAADALRALEDSDPSFFSPASLRRCFVRRGGLTRCPPRAASASCATASASSAASTRSRPLRSSSGSRGDAFRASNVPEPALRDRLEAMIARRDVERPSGREG